MVSPRIAYEGNTVFIQPTEQRGGGVAYKLLEASKTPPPLPSVTPTPLPEVLRHIAFCESRNRQFDDNGEILLGKNKNDVGRYQINTDHWGEKAEQLGHDLYTEEGNEAMAFYLYREFGTKPWYWSRKCWESR